MDLRIDKLKNIEGIKQTTETPKAEVENTIFKFSINPPSDNTLVKSMWSEDIKARLHQTLDDIGIKKHTLTILKDDNSAITKARSHLVDLIRLFEGDAYHYYEGITVSYDDTFGKTTCGFGELSKNLRDQETSYNNLCKNLREHAQYVKNILKSNIGKNAYDEMPDSIIEALIDLSFCKGPGKISSNKNLMTALKNKDYSKVVANLEYLYSGSNKADKTKEEEGLYYRSLGRMILATRDLSGKELDQAKQEIAAFHKEIEDAEINNLGIEKMYEQFTTGKITSPPISAESSKFKITDKYKGKGLRAVAKDIYESFGKTNVTFDEFYKELVRINRKRETIVLNSEINVPYLKNFKNAQATTQTESPSATTAATTVAPTDTTTVDEEPIISQVDLEEVEVTPDEPGFFSKVRDTIGSFFSSMWDSVVNFFSGDDENEQKSPFQNLLDSPDTTIVEEGDFQVITSKHTVKEGDGIWRLSKTYNLNESEFCRENGITDRNKIEKGQVLTITKLGYKAKDGEKLEDIANKFGINTNLLRDLNKLKGDKVDDDMMLEIPGFAYKVQKGDTLFKISKKYGVSVETLKKLNGLKDNTIHPDQNIKIVYNDVDYAIPESKKTRIEDATTNTVTEIIDMTGVRGLEGCKYLTKRKVNGKTIATRRVFEPTGQGKLSGKTIIVNAGHGFTSSGIAEIGTDGRNGVEDEYIVNYHNAMRLTQRLQAQGARVIYLQGNEDPDELISSELRKKENKADLFISIHVNSSENRNQKDRMEIFYHKESQAGKAMAKIADQNMEDFYEGKNYKIEDKPCGYQVLRVMKERYPKTPAILWEVAFMNSKEGQKILKNDKLMNQYADTMCESIVEYFDKEKELVFYTVKQGDTLGGIAEKHGVTLKALKKANGLKNNNITAGQVLQIPKKEKKE